MSCTSEKKQNYQQQYACKWVRHKISRAHHAEDMMVESATHPFEVRKLDIIKSVLRVKDLNCRQFVDNKKIRERGP